CHPFYYSDSYYTDYW
nr:immunoglobulin heavy chain junction region [Macaca mulatta]